MDYSRHYDRLIERARTRVLDGYVEVHHVIPRCMGGTDEPFNLVQLTAEEHFVAHALLHKMHPLNHKLTLAMGALLRNSRGKRSNKAYGWAKRKLSIALSEFHTGRVKSAQERANIAAAGRRRAPRKFSEQARANMAAARRRVWEKLRAAGTHKLIGQKTVATRRANGSYQFSEEWRRNIGQAAKGRTSPMKGKRTPEHVREKQRIAALNRWRPKQLDA